MNPAEIGIAVADAVVATLNAGVTAGAFASVYADGFTAARCYESAVVLPDLSALRVDVLLTAPVEVERSTQTDWVARIPIDVAVRKQCKATDTATADALATLAGEIWDYLSSHDGEPRALTGCADADLYFPDSDQKEPPVVILADTLHENQFTAIVRLDYEVHGE